MKIDDRLLVESMLRTLSILEVQNDSVESVALRLEIGHHLARVKTLVRDGARGSAAAQMRELYRDYEIKGPNQ
jgi:hypothetical protein